MRQRSSDERHQADQHQRRGAPHLGAADRGQAAEQPEHDGRELVIRVGQDLEQRDGGAGERAHHHACEHQHQDRLAAVHHGGDGIDEADGGEPHGEGHELDAGHGQGQEDAEHGAEAGAGRYAEDVGRHQRVAKQGLVGGAGGSYCRTDEHGGEDARQAHLEQHGVDLALGWRAREPAADGGDYFRQRQRVGADQRRAKHQSRQENRQSADDGEPVQARRGDGGADGALSGEVVHGVPFLRAGATLRLPAPHYDARRNGPPWPLQRLG